MSDASPALAVSGLEVRYGGVAAVRDVSLEVGRGEIVGLVGPNGAGKSSTLMAIMGAVSPSAGDVLMGGRSIRGMRSEDIARSGIALVPEGRHIFSNLSVRENLRLGLVGRRESNGVAKDLDWIQTLFPVVKDFADRHAVTILLVEQRAQITVSFCSRTYVMSNGQIRMTLTPGDADNTERMVSAYFAS